MYSSLETEVKEGTERNMKCGSRKEKERKRNRVSERQITNGIVTIDREEKVFETNRVEAL